MNIISDNIALSTIALNGLVGTRLTNQSRKGGRLALLASVAFVAASRAALSAESISINDSKTGATSNV